jgi:hypothetical protein
MVGPELRFQWLELERRYFPRELPPHFTTAAFGAFIAIQAQRATLQAPAKSWSRCVAHNLARPGSLRRPLKIPNPMHHLECAEALVRAVVPRLSRRSFARLRARNRLKWMASHECAIAKA